MPINIADDGSFELAYQGPWTGLHVQLPENVIPDTATPALSNFMLRNGEIRSTPVLTKQFNAPEPVNPILGQYSFLDANGVYHTLAFTPRALFQLDGNQIPPIQNAWAYLGGPSIDPSNPVSARAFANVCYYTNGAPVLPYWDGISQFAVGTATGIDTTDAPLVIPGSVGPLSLGGLYLGELNDQLLLANVTAVDESDGTIYQFPQRLWWSANGLPTVWSPATNTSAGFNDFLDCPDVLTGIMTIGIQGFLFRTNGITQFTPTGNGLNPFQFDHLWASDHGVGNVYPWSIAQYGPMGFFISTDNIYQMSVNSFDTVGGTARDAIYADLSQASANPVASIVPALGLGYVYLQYVIAIPLTNFTRFYRYSTESQYWEQWDAQNLIITGKEEVCWTGQLPPYGSVGVYPASVSSGSTGANAGQGGGAPSQPPDNPPMPPNPEPQPPIV